MLNILKYNIPYELLLDVQGYKVAYAVSGEADDYVAETSERMRLLAKKLYTFPFYLHFESYYDTSDEILAETGFDILYKPSGRTVLTQTGRKLFQAEVPAFTVKISDEVALDEVFALWFQFAFDNNLWALTQEDSVMYKDGYAQIELKEDEIILVTEHDAYGFTVLTNRAELQHEEVLRSTLAEAFQ